jgi:RNA polymerase sigma-70 factor (ECF subfamily)
VSATLRARGGIERLGASVRTMTESELIERARNGEDGAIRALYLRYAPRVYATIRRLAGDDSLAEDWAQEAWVRAIRALPTFRGDSQFSTWLHRIAVNSALHGRRSRLRRTERETPLSETIPAGPLGERTLLRLQLERALERLPERMRQVLVLHDVEGYTHEEIGEALGVTPGTSKSQLFKARARMRQLLRAVSEPVVQEEAWHT